MICPICQENSCIRQEPPLNPKECDHKAICQKCKDAWKDTCFKKNERATCPLCRNVYAITDTELSNLKEITRLLKEASRLFDEIL
jgi:hypothetical protein